MYVLDLKDHIPVLNIARRHQNGSYLLLSLLNSFTLILVGTHLSAVFSISPGSLAYGTCPLFYSVKKY